MCTRLRYLQDVSEEEEEEEEEDKVKDKDGGSRRKMGKLIFLMKILMGRNKEDASQPLSLLVACR